MWQFLSILVPECFEKLRKGRAVPRSLRVGNIVDTLLPQSKGNGIITRQNGKLTTLRQIQDIADSIGRVKPNLRFHRRGAYRDSTSIS